MAYCNCCRDGCLLVEVAERLEDAMVRQVASYYQGIYQEDPELFSLFQLHSYIRLLVCNQTAIISPDKALGMFRMLEGLPNDLRDRFLVAIQRQQRHQQFVSGQPALENPQQKKGRRWLKVLGS